MSNAFFQEPIHLGGLHVANRAWLAPLAGVSDVPFRRICQEHGAGLSYVEMLSAVAVHRRNTRTMALCRRHASEPALGVQVTGATPEKVAAAIRFLDTLPFDTVDINMGCSVRKVISSGSGSGILGDPDRVSATVRAARDASERPLTVKTRLGVSRDRLCIEDTAARVAREGADGFIIHGRTRDERYGTPADAEGVRAGIDAARAHAARPMVLVGNGDVFSHSAAERLRQRTGCDAVMISRGALGNPWIFREVLKGRTVHPVLAEWGDVVLRYLDYHESYYGDTELAAIIVRKHLLWFIKGFPCNKELGAKVGLVKSLDEARAHIKSYLREWPGDIIRFEGAHRADARFGANSKYDPKYDMDRVHDRAASDDDDEMIQIQGKQDE